MKWKKANKLNSGSKYETLKITYSKNKLNYFWALLFFILWAGLTALIWWYMRNSLPTPISIDNESEHANEFIAERAERRLQELVRIGPRYLGSVNNEQAAVNVLMNAINNIQTFISKNNRIEVDRQVGSGSIIYSRRFPVIYKNVQNIIVRLKSVDSISNATLLINSHFDTVYGSPGAGDAGIMIAAMLEVLRVLATSEEKLRHPIVFLFNGAEEASLLGAHTFLNNHQWAQDIKAFINLDSMGNGGKDILFRTSPKNSWLIKHYQNAAKYPQAHVLAHEVFNLNLIPSDTDFTMFTKHGSLSGIDIAHYRNGYVYHTKNDIIKTIPRGTLQNTGTNLLALARSLANSDELENPKIHEDDDSVYYDYLGLFLISYGSTENLIINITVSVVGLIVICISFYLMKRNSGLFGKRIFTRFIIIFLIQVLSIVLGIALTVGIALLLDEFDKTLSWYTYNWFIFGLYFCPFYFGLSLIPLIYIKLTEENEFFPLNYKVQMFMHSSCFILIILTLLATIFGIKSAYLVMIPVFFYTISVLLNIITTLQEKLLSWTIFPILLQIIPFTFIIYVTFIIFEPFIPVMGRSSGNNPEIIIAAISFLMAFLLGAFLIPLIFAFRRPEIYVTLLALTGIIFIALAFTPVGFPYGSKTNQRFTVIHTRQIVHDRNNNILSNETGYYIKAIDRRSTSLIEDSVVNMSLAQKPTNEKLNCGFPFYSMSCEKNDLWIPASAPILIKVPVLRNTKRRLVSSDVENKSRIRYDYTLVGPNHMAIYLSVKPDCNLVKWSFDLSLGDVAKRNFSIHYIYGTYSNDTTLQFWLEFDKNQENLGAPCYNIAVTGALNHYPIYRTDDFRTFLASFPDWTVVADSMAQYESFEV